MKPVKPVSFLVLSSIFSSLTLSSVAWSMPVMENWYMNRGRSNMEIGNYKAAIEAYEKVVERDPDNREAMRSLGIAYENQGLKDKAIDQYDKYLSRNPDDSEIAFRQADALGWSRYSYRKQDALKYYKMGLDHKNDNQMRLKYARLLASNKDTSVEAIHQYNTVLRSQPMNAEAHRGLAKAYAWNGQKDLALYHADLAKQRGASTQDLSRLEQDLRQGREPALSGDFEWISQPGDQYGLTGIQLFGDGRKDLSPFVTGRLRAGFENFSHDSESATGGVFSAGIEYRPDEFQKISSTLEYHSIAPITSTTASRTSGTTGNAGLSGLVGKAEYLTLNGGTSYALGFERSIRQDSLLSIAGSRLSGVGMGQARANDFYGQLGTEAGSFQLKAKPYVGWISTLNAPANMMIGADGSIERPMITESAFTLSAGHFVQLSHYTSDRSATTGNGGGYFSPQFFMSQSPRLMTSISFTDRQKLDAMAGPALQYVRDDSVSGGWQLGAELNLGYVAQFTRRLSWRIQGGYTKVADAYSHVQIGNMLTYLF
jgi:Tfp pilus assembly protein PilF